MNELSETSELSIVPPSAVEAMERASIDLQIATAHKYPRSMQSFHTSARSMALIDEDTAASCIYSRPVGGGKFAEGLSVRAAEIVAASYGNIRVAATVIEQTERYVKARGFCHDLEKNYAVATEVIESTIKRDGTPYDERMRIVIAKSALAKARRDATFQVVPKALFKKIEMECRKLALGEGDSVSTRRARIVTWITKLAIDPKRVWAALGIVGEADLTEDHFLTLTGVKTAISDGDTTVDDAFPKIIAAARVGQGETMTERAAAEKVEKPAKAKEVPPKTEAKPTPPAPPADEKPAETNETPAAAAKPAEPPPKATPPKPSGPKAAPLIAQLRAEAAQWGCSKNILSALIVERGKLKEGQSIDDLTAEDADALLKGFNEPGGLKDDIVPPSKGGE